MEKVAARRVEVEVIEVRTEVIDEQLFTVTALSNPVVEAKRQDTSDGPYRIRTGFKGIQDARLCIDCASDYVGPNAHRNNSGH